MTRQTPDITRDMQTRLRLLDAGRPSWFGKLMSREMIEPTPAFQERVDPDIKPLRDQLHPILRDMTGDGPTDLALDRRACCIVIGQCCFFHHSKPVVEKLFPCIGYDPYDIEALANHVTRFCVAGLESVGQKRRSTSGVTP